MDPLDDQGVPEIPFVKDGDFAALTKLTGFLRSYHRNWQKALRNFAILLFIAVILWLICANFTPDPRTWPWWIYPLVLVLLWFAVLNGRYFAVCLYQGIRWLPDAITIRQAERALMLKWRRQTLAQDNAIWQKAMAEITGRMDQKDVEDLRKQGFL